ncbi:MAG: c-type cytochrome biogenesis protein CcsB [candidate division NC10 bacterium]|nr:c-type cytochrome biogenesis protein CcsB [candidate division NC10 bacterium]
MNLLFFHLSWGTYLLATLHYLLFAAAKKRIILTVAHALALLGFLLHTASLGLRAYESGHAPWATLFESLSFFGWCIALLYFWSERQTGQKAIGVFIFPLIAALISGALLLPSTMSELPPSLRSPWLWIHGSFSFLGHAALAIAFCTGLMYLLLERQVKGKHFKSLYYFLPPLHLLDDLGYRGLALGFGLLSIGIITGAIWAEQAWGAYWSWDPKETCSLITWVIYAFLLHARLLVGWRGKRAAIVAIIGFLAVLINFLGVNLLPWSRHAYLSYL